METNNLWTALFTNFELILFSIKLVVFVRNISKVVDVEVKNCLMRALCAAHHHVLCAWNMPAVLIPTDGKEQVDRCAVCRGV